MELVASKKQTVSYAEADKRPRWEREGFDSEDAWIEAHDKKVADITPKLDALKRSLNS